MAYDDAETSSGPDTRTQQQITVVSLEMPVQQSAPEGTLPESDSTADDGAETDQQSPSEPTAPSVGFI